MFAGVVGNSHIQRCLELMVQKQRIGSSFLFAGPDGVGKSLFADRLAQAVVKARTSSTSHPDIHHYRPEGKTGMHTILSMRQLAEEVYFPPYASKKKFFILHDADRMLPYSSNALLKTFEEPPLDTVIILLSSAPELILPTIVSRCRALYFSALSDQEMLTLMKEKTSLSEAEALRVVFQAKGSAKRAFQMLEKGEHPVKKLMFEVLSKGRFDSYGHLMARAKEIAAMVDTEVKAIEEKIRQELVEAYTDKLTAVQKDAIEKEVEGVVSLQQLYESQIIFDTILFWYRDLHVLHCRGDAHLLLHPEWNEIYPSTAIETPLQPIETVLDVIKEAKLAIARSTPLHLCLENVLLKLHFL